MFYDLIHMYCLTSTKKASLEPVKLSQSIENYDNLLRTKKMFQAQERNAYNYSTSNNNYIGIKCVLGYAEKVSGMNVFAAV